MTHQPVHPQNAVMTAYWAGFRGPGVSHPYASRVHSLRGGKALCGYRPRPKSEPQVCATDDDTYGVDCPRCLNKLRQLRARTPMDTRTLRQERDTWLRPFAVSGSKQLAPVEDPTLAQLLVYIERESRAYRHIHALAVQALDVYDDLVKAALEQQLAAERRPPDLTNG